MATWLIHGFNVGDGGGGTVGRLYPHISPIVCEYSYGWSGLLGLAWANRRAVRGLMQRIKPGDSIVAHSNGCLIAWQIAQVIPVSSVVCINPALRRDTRWPKELPVLCMHNSTDWVVQLGRAWSKLFPFDGIDTQGWGAAGRYGFTAPSKKVTNFDTAMGWWGKPVKGHSGVFREPEYWGGIIDKWLTTATVKGPL